MPVYWHIISKDKTLAQGYVPDKQITDQIAKLNQDYGEKNILWMLRGTTRTIRTEWFDHAGPGTTEQTAMKSALRQGGKGDLNVYTVGFTNAKGLLGYATFPSSYNAAPKDDGVVILYSTVPGGAAAPTNLGRTLTHEAGHWVGLYHTFQGGCDTVVAPTGGDYVSDTRPELMPAYGCPTGRTTCANVDVSGGVGGVLGPDPIHNFMDYTPNYTDDSCMTMFTSGQVTRMKMQYAMYRA
ncbi:hypothetical protein C8J57DRAFT_1449292 [Mycena rebaudengoi]|nr:hypothetical protein C8J57DRAFT_1449292 [Mycena rebaudengoi]